MQMYNIKFLLIISINWQILSFCRGGVPCKDERHDYTVHKDPLQHQDGPAFNIWDEIIFDVLSKKFIVGVDIQFLITSPLSKSIPKSSKPLTSKPGKLQYIWNMGDGICNLREKPSWNYPYKMPGNYSYFAFLYFNNTVIYSKKQNLVVENNLDRCRFNLSFKLDKNGEKISNTQLDTKDQTPILIPMNREVKLSADCGDVNVSELSVKKINENHEEILLNDNGNFSFIGFKNGEVQVCFLHNCAGNSENVFNFEMKGLEVVPGFVHSLADTNGTIGEKFRLTVYLAEYIHGDLNETCVKIDYGDKTTDKCNAELNSTACEDMYGVAANCTLQLEGESEFNVTHYYETPGEHILSVVMSNKASRETIEVTVNVDFDPCIPRIQLNPFNPKLNNPLKFTQNDEVPYSTIITLDNCYHLENTKVWSLVRVDKMTGKEMGHVTVRGVKTTETATVEYEPRTLSNGFYKLVLNVTMNSLSDGGYARSSEQFTYFQIKPAQVFVSLFHYQSAISFGTDSILQISPQTYTIDSNQPSYRLKKGEKYSWSCRQVDEIEMGDYENKINPPDFDGCFDGGPPNYNLGEIELSGDYFVTDTSYLLNVSVWPYPEEPMFSGKLTFTVVDSKTPIVYISCQMPQQCFINSNEGLTVNPTTTFILTGHCYTNCDDKFEFDWFIKLVSEGGTLVPNDDSSFYIDIFQLSPFNKIYVTFQMTNTKNLNGWSTMLVTQNQSPINGNCSVTPPFGKAFETLFTITCESWNDTDYILNYRYFLDDGFSLRDVMVTNAPQLVVILPSGSSKFNYVVKLFAGIRDRLGAETVAPIGDVTVEPGCTYFMKVFEKQQNVLAAASSEQLLSFTQTMASYARENDGLMPPDVNNQSVCMCHPAYLKCFNQSQRDFCAEQTYNESLCDDENERNSLEVFANITKMLSKLNIKKPDQINPATDAAYVLMSSTKYFGIRSKEDVHSILSVAGSVISDHLDSFSEEKLNQTAFSMLRMTSTLTKTINRDLASPLKSDKDYMYQEAVKQYDTSLPENPADIAYEEDKTAEEYKTYASNKLQRQTGGKVAHQVKKIFSTISSQQINNQLPNEQPYTLETGGAKLMLHFPNNNESGNTSIQINSNAMVELPTSTVCDLGKNCDQLYTKTVYFESNLHSYADKHSQLTTGSLEISYNYLNSDNGPNANEMKVNNLSSPIVLVLDSGFDENRTKADFVSPKLGRNFLLSTHTIRVEAHSAIHIKINKTVEDAHLMLYLQYEENPGPLNYNWTTDFPSGQRDLTWFLDNDELDNKAGTYYFGVGEIVVNNNNSDFEYYGNESLPSDPMFNEGGYNFTQYFSTAYSLLIVTPSCMFVKKDKWDGGGCKVGCNTSLSKIYCECTHLTTFAAGLIVPPNNLDFDFILKNASLEKNLTIYTTLIFFAVAYTLLMMWGRRKDKRDQALLESIPLFDNNPRDKYIYEIVVRTGVMQQASTKSRYVMRHNTLFSLCFIELLYWGLMLSCSISCCAILYSASVQVNFILCGTRVETGVREFGGAERHKIFSRGSRDRFVMTVPKPLGKLMWFRVWHDNAGPGQFASWYLDDVTIVDIQTKEKFIFICHKWFALEKGDGLIERNLTVTSPYNKSEWNHAFVTNARKKFTDGHLWFSVFARPAQSRFTRCQRVTCCFCVLLSSMLASAMWYDTIPTNSNGLQFGPFSFSMAELGVGIMSNLVVFPINFLLVFLFRKSRLRRKLPSKIKGALESSGHQHGIVSHSSEEVTNGTKKKKFLLPWIFRYVAWFLAISTLILCILFIAFYAIQLQDQKTRKWITSLFLGFITSALFTQPIKIICIVAIFACIFKKTEDDDEDRWDDEEEFALEYTGDEDDNDEEWHKSYHANPTNKLMHEKETRTMQQHMYDILREFSAYVVFLLILLILVYFNRSVDSFLLQDGLRKLFLDKNFNDIERIEDIWKWANLTLAPGLRATNYYNDAPATPYERGFISDRVNRLMGFATLRQVRVKPASCTIYDRMTSLTKQCHSYSSIFNEDHQDYGPQWDKSKVDEDRPEYQHKSAMDLSTLPTVGTLDVYSGAGYVLMLSGSVDDMTNHFDLLVKEQWLDQKSRAMLIEFFLYNAQVNLFTVNSILIELPPIGGLFKSAQFQPVKLLRYERNGLIMKVAEGVFIMYLLVFLVKEGRNLKKQKSSYFKQLWNWFEIILIILCLLAIVCYFLRQAATNIEIKKFQKAQGNQYTNYSYAGAMDDTFTVLMAFILFVSTMKFSRLLRFNKNIALVTTVLKQSRTELFQFGLVSFLMYMAYALLFYLLLMQEDEAFSSLPRAMEETLSMLLCKVPFTSFRVYSPYIGSLAFFTFSVMVISIMVNLFVTILNLYQTAVRTDSTKQMNEFEMIQFMWTKLKINIGFASASSDKMDFDDELKSSTVLQECEEKMDLFLYHLNRHYFRGSLNYLENNTENMNENKKMSKKRIVCSE